MLRNAERDVRSSAVARAAGYQVRATAGEAFLEAAGLTPPVDRGTTQTGCWSAAFGPG